MAIFNQVVSGGGGSETQFGINIKGWCGDLDNLGQIRTDQAVGTLTGLNTATELSWFRKFTGSSGLVGAVDLRSVKYGVFDYAFEGTRITSLNLRELFNASRMSRVCNGLSTLVEVDLSDAFYLYDENATGLMHAFQRCTSLREIRLPAIRADSFEDYGGGFNYDYVSSMIYGCSNLVVHFSSSFGEDLTTLQGYDQTDEFFRMMCGYDAATIASCSLVFDLPANDPFYATVQGTQREFKRYPSHDTSSSLAWKENGGSIIVYTSGTTDPVEGDTLYSDSSCTTSVGTISEFIPIRPSNPDEGGDEEEYYEEEPEE